MMRRVALLLAVALFVAVDVEAGRFSRGGCANGQCGRSGYYQADAYQTSAKQWFKLRLPNQVLQSNRRLRLRLSQYSIRQRDVASFDGTFAN
jgi:hypothetical protein